MSTKVTILVTSAIFQKSSWWWLHLLLPLLSSGLGTPGCPCVHGVLLGMVTAGGTMCGCAHPGPSQGCAGWLTLPGMLVLDHGFFSPEHLKSEAARADRQSWFLDAAKPAMGGARHCGEEKSGRTVKAGKVLWPGCQK